MLTLLRAETLVRGALAKARALDLNKVSAVAIDITGQVKVAMREDGAGIAGVEIATGKALSALTFGCTSGQISDALAGNPLAGPSVLSAVTARLVLLKGGVPIYGEDGAIIGAIGVAGDAPDNDEKAALGAFD